MTLAAKFVANRVFFTVTAALALGGCAVGPDYHPLTPAEALPAHFSQATQNTATAPSAWWKTFGDDGLNALVDAALAHNPDLDAADANIRQARASVVQIKSAQSFQLTAEARAGHDQFSKDSENFANIPFPNPKSGFNDYRAGLDASWEIDLFGHTARSVESAKARAEGTEAERADVALRVSAETARNVLDYRHLQLRIANAKAILNDNHELLRLTQLQRAAGLASDLDVHQAEIAVRNAEGVLPPLEANAQSTLAALVPLTALTQDDIASRLGTTPVMPTLPTANQFAVSSSVLEQRPDVRVAERQLAAATADMGVAISDQYPRFTLVGDGGWDAIHAGNFGQQASRYWNFGPQLYLPILTGGRVKAEIQQNTAARDAALASYRKTVLAALADTESAMLRCQGDDGHLKQTDAAVSLQNQQAQLTAKRVKVGEASQLELLSSRIQLESLQDAQLSSRQSLTDDLVLLFKALGGNEDAQASRKQAAVDR